MLLHNNTIAATTFLSTTESPSSSTTASVYSHQNPQTLPTNHQYFPSPWIDQRFITDPFFVRILFFDLIYLFFLSSNLPGVRENK
jgi:hypothetical protein